MDKGSGGVNQGSRGSVKSCLFLIQNFRQGFGGGPESIRLAAYCLRNTAISSDVWDGKNLVKDIGKLGALPVDFKGSTQCNDLDTEAYQWIVCVGVWQPAKLLMKVLAKSHARQKFYYLPRGGLCKVEFVRLRDAKKIPYLLLVEVIWICLAKGILFSSRLEFEKSVFPITLFRRKAHIGPDFFLPSWPKPEQLPKASIFTFSTLAELHPRKGILELVTAFLDWVQEEGLLNDVRLVIGGACRPGYEWYLQKVREVTTRSRAGSCVEFAGTITHSDRKSFYQRTEIFVVASHFESFGLTLLEAMHSGCQVLTVQDIGALEYLDGANNITVASGLQATQLRGGLKEAYQRAKNTETRLPEQIDQESGIFDSINLQALEVWKTMLE